MENNQSRESAPEPRPNPQRKRRRGGAGRVRLTFAFLGLEPDAFPFEVALRFVLGSSTSAEMDQDQNNLGQLWSGTREPCTPERMASDQRLQPTPSKASPRHPSENHN